MTDIAKIREEKYTQLKKKLDKQNFRAKHLLRVMRYQYKRYFGTELPYGYSLANECRSVVTQAKRISETHTGRGTPTNRKMGENSIHRW